MAAPTENKSDCQCTNKWQFAQFGLRKGEDGKTWLEKLKGQKNSHELLADEVILCLVFQKKGTTKSKCCQIVNILTPSLHQKSSKTEKTDTQKSNQPLTFREQ